MNVCSSLVDAENTCNPLQHYIFAAEFIFFSGAYGNIEKTAS